MYFPKLFGILREGTRYKSLQETSSIAKNDCSSDRVSQQTTLVPSDHFQRSKLPFETSLKLLWKKSRVNLYTVASDRSRSNRVISRRTTNSLGESKFQISEERPPIGTIVVCARYPEEDRYCSSDFVTPGTNAVSPSFSNRSLASTFGIFCRVYDPRGLSPIDVEPVRYCSVSKSVLNPSRSRLLRYRKPRESNEW